MLAPDGGCAHGALDHYLNPTAQIMGSTREPEPMYLANPAYDTESLLANNTGNRQC